MIQEEKMRDKAKMVNLTFGGCGEKYMSPDRVARLVGASFQRPGTNLGCRLDAWWWKIEEATDQFFSLSKIK